MAELGTASVVRASAANPAERITLTKGLVIPAGLAVTDHDLWVSDWATGIVWQIIADGEQLDQPIAVATDLILPEGLAVDADGRLLIVETGSGRLLRVDPATDEVNTIAEGLALGAEAPQSQLAPPTFFFNGVAVGSSGAIYVTGDVDNVVYRIEPDL